MSTELRIARRLAASGWGAGFGSLALASLLNETAAAEDAAPDRRAGPLAPKAPHFPPRAKRVIFLFMPGGPSQVDTFDPKPRLTQDSGRSGAETGLQPECGRRSPHAAGIALEVSAIRPVGTRSQRALPECRRQSRRPVRHALDGHRRSQSSGRLPADEHRRTGLLAAQRGFLGDLRAGKRKPKPAGLHGHRPGPADRGCPAIRSQFPAGRLSRHVRLGHAASDSQSEESAAATSRSSGASSTRWPGSTSSTRRSARRRRAN